jgi:hypothetical protein
LADPVVAAARPGQFEKLKIWFSKEEIRLLAHLSTEVA